MAAALMLRPFVVILSWSAALPLRAPCSDRLPGFL